MRQTARGMQPTPQSFPRAAPSHPGYRVYFGTSVVPMMADNIEPRHPRNFFATATGDRHTIGVRTAAEGAALA